MTIFIATFLTVYLLAFQQQNVIHGHYWLAAMTSFVIAAAQFAMIQAVATGQTIDFILMGAGGSMGVTLSMFTHRRWIKKKG